MNSLPIDDSLQDLQAQTRRQREALEAIVARCGRVNFPPDLVVEIDAVARQGLGEALRPGPSATA